MAVDAVKEQFLNYMSMMQLYWVSWTAYPRGEDDLPRSGQYVFEHDDSNWLAGFVAEVDYNKEKSLLCLFKPTDLNLPQAEVVRQSIPDKEVYDRLATALKANPAMKREWIEACYSEKSSAAEDGRRNKEGNLWRQGR